MRHAVLDNLTPLPTKRKKKEMTLACVIIKGC
jgi:hypothetical protein